jgi:MFS transporter, OFA family, oxalate/formate antiporter
VGIVSSGAPLGGFIAQPLFAWIMKRTGSWEIGWLCAAGFAFLGIAGIAWLRNKPSDLGQHPDGIDPALTPGAAAAGRPAARTYRTAQTWALREAVRTRALWCLISCYCMTAMPLYLVTTHGLMHVTDRGFASLQGAFFLSLVVLCGGMARFPMGSLADYIEARWLLAAALTGTLLSLLVIWRAPSFPALLAAGCLFGFSYGSGLVLVPTTVGNYYSPSAFANINSFMYPFQVGLGALVPAAAGYLFDFNRSYDLAFIALSVLAAAAALSALAAAPPRKRSPAPGAIAAS